MIFKKEIWTPKPKENYIVLDYEGKKQTVALSIENGDLIVSVYNGSKWVVKVRHPMTGDNLRKMKHLVEDQTLANDEMKK